MGANWKFEVIVGTGFDAEGNAISPEGLESSRALLESEACNLFGGFSRYTVAGGWRNDRGEIVTEASDVWVIFSSPVAGVEGFARFARSLLRQHSVCVVYPDASVSFLTATR
jgi:hypothetical protein